MQISSSRGKKKKKIPILIPLNGKLRMEAGFSLWPNIQICSLTDLAVLFFKYAETEDEDVSLDDCWFIKFIAVFTPAFIRRVCPVARSEQNEQKHILHLFIPCTSFPSAIEFLACWSLDDTLRKLLVHLQSNLITLSFDDWSVSTRPNDLFQWIGLSLYFFGTRPVRRINSQHVDEGKKDGGGAGGCRRAAN